MKMKVFSRTKSLKTSETTSMDFPPSPSPRNKSRKNLASQEVKTPHDSELHGGDNSPTTTTTGKKSSPRRLRFHRNMSISSSMQQMSAVKRAFSRTSSISERYCRIHDQRVALALSSDDEEPIGTPSLRHESLIGEKKSDHGRRTIVKSCKRVLGL